MPTTTDMVIEMTAASAPTIRDTRAEYTSCANTSCPSLVVPSKWADDGPLRPMTEVVEGFPTRLGPATAAKTKMPRMTNPICTFRERSAERNQPFWSVGRASPSPSSESSLSVTTVIAATSSSGREGRKRHQQ